MGDDDAADFNEKDISEKGTEATKDLLTMTLLNRPFIPKPRGDKSKGASTHRAINPIHLLLTPEPDKRDSTPRDKVGSSAPPIPSQKAYLKQFAAAGVQVKDEYEDFETANDNDGESYPEKISMKNVIREAEVEDFVTAVNEEGDDDNGRTSSNTNKEQQKDTTDTSVHNNKEERKYGSPKPLYMPPKKKSSVVKRKLLSLISPKNNV